MVLVHRLRFKDCQAANEEDGMTKIAVFVDFWNFQIGLNDEVANRNGDRDVRMKIDWRQLGHVFAIEGCNVLSIDPADHSYEGCYVYTSFNPKTEEGKKYRNWATTWLDRQPGINVKVRPRKPKAHPKCPICHRAITHCPHKGCEQPIVATVEKGVDTLLVTDLLRLGMQGAYDAAILVTSDADMVPAVEFIQISGKKVIQAGFPPLGVSLATECWGSFDIMKIIEKIKRP